MRKLLFLLICCIGSGILSGCFHIPDEDRLPSKNDVTNDDENEKGKQEIIEQFNTSIMYIQNLRDYKGNNNSIEYGNDNTDEGNEEYSGDIIEDTNKSL